MSDFRHLRDRMVDIHLARRGVRDERVLDAMRVVPRERFLTASMGEFAYEDAPLPIEEGQTISQPYIVAAMIEAAEIKPTDNVLEVGAGAGYAAAVISRMAKRIYAVERHDRLARVASQRLKDLGYSNAEIIIGDGTRGLPEHAPFDAIIVSAAAPAVPEALKKQLAIGGRLVIPVGDDRRQRLSKVIRRNATTYETIELEPVMFVPLIGEHGWAQDGRTAATDHKPGASKSQSLQDMIKQAAEDLPDFGDPSFGALFDRFADRRVVLLGEASHGTVEFYRARAAITRHLVANHGFTIVAVEADWPDAGTIDRYVRHRSSDRPEEPPFQRFPSWMWRNTEISAFTEWLREHNGGIADVEERAGFYGLDIYNMSGSIGAVLDYLDRVDPDAATVARERYGCLTPWQKNPATYGRAALSRGYAECEDAVIEQCQALLRQKLDYARNDHDAFLDAVQNARLIASAKRYYRIMYYGGAESWNLRDTHMFETLQHLLAAKGVGAKAVVWAHNSHIGDARFTDMGAVRDELNIGQLCRQSFGDDAALVGFGTHTGTVAAADDWDGEMRVMDINPSRSDSYERRFHDCGKERFLLDLTKGKHEALRRALSQPQLERFIGVIYRPETELGSHYSRAVLADQFDAYVWFDETQAVTPLGPEHHRGMPETYPFGE